MLNERQVSNRYGMTLSWLRIARIKGTGPDFIKIGSRVFYLPEDVDAFINKHRVRSTSEKAA